MGFLGGSVVKDLLAMRESTPNAENASLISGSERTLEKEMATHSNILASEMPWTKEPVRL